jgi:hypothetical protein
MELRTKQAKLVDSFAATDVNNLQFFAWHKIVRTMVKCEFLQLQQVSAFVSLRNAGNPLAVELRGSEEDR